MKTAFSKFDKLESTPGLFPGQDSLKNHFLPKWKVFYVDDPTDYSILKEKENAEMALEDLNKIEMNGDPSVNKKKRIVKRIYREYLKDMNDLIDRWYSLRLIQSLKDD